jgi:hypothetical protein
MASTEELQRRIEKLEFQLAQYHEHLEAALEHDRDFQMKATWGVVNSLVGWGAFFGVLWLADKLGMDGWILGTIAGFAALIAWVAASGWSDKGRKNDLKKLSQLPKWDR